MQHDVTCFQRLEAAQSLGTAIALARAMTRVLSAGLLFAAMVTTGCMAGEVSFGDGRDGDAAERTDDGGGDAAPTQSGAAGSQQRPWPSCEQSPADATTMTIPALWLADPPAPIGVWLEGVYVAAVSGGVCRPDAACEMFVQQAPGYDDVVQAAQGAVRVVAAIEAAPDVAGAAAGDRVDLAGFAWRHEGPAMNELVVEVSDLHRGCVHRVGEAVMRPAPATLHELSVADYARFGPMLVEIEGVSGSPKEPDSTFAIWPPGGSDGDLTSVSPFLLPGQRFNGLSYGELNAFERVTGVFAVYSPAPGAHFEELYPRGMADIVLAEPASND
jgi:hypothetical protein